MFNQGEQFKFSKNIDAKYGEGTAEMLEFEARQIMKFTRAEYQTFVTYYKSVVNKIKLDKNLE